MPTSTLIITVDPDCCRCSSKLQKVLCCIQERGEFVIDKILYEGDKVKVSGPFNAEKLYCKLWCKLRNIVKDIQVAPPPAEKPKPECKPKHDCKPEKPPCKVVYPCPYPYPYPYPQCPSPWPPCGCPTPSCDCPHTKPPALPPCGCPPPFCWCHAKPTPSPKPPPPPPKLPTCGCTTWPSCRCCTYPPYPILVCEESPPYGACAVM